MSDVLEAVRAKYPEYKGILDDELAVALGNKYPQYLDHADFKAEYDRGRGLGVIPGVGVEGETGFRPGPEMIPPPTSPPVERIVLDQPVRIPRIGPQKGPASQLAAGLVNAAAGIVESTVNEPAFALAGAPGAVGKLARAAITPVVAAQLPGMAVESGKELLKGNVQGAVEQGVLPLAAAYGLKRSLTPLTDAAAKTGPPVSGATLEMPRGARPPMEAAPELYLALPEQAAAQAKAMTREATAAYEAPNPPKPEVPGTPAEPYETVLEAIRNSKADTTSKVQALFHAAQLTRQQAAELRRQAFGQEKPIPPAAEPIMDKLAEAIDKGDFSQVKKLAKGLSESTEVPLDVFDLEKQPVEEAKPAAEAAKAETPPTSKAPDWAMEELKRQGWNTKWPFVQADLYNKDFRDLIRSDPGISAEEKAKILSFGPKEEPPAAPLAEPPSPPKLETPPETFPPGPGAQTAGEPQKAQIEQLTDAFKGIEGQKVPIGDQVKQAFDVGGRTTAAKDAFGRALGGLKATGDYLVNLFKGATLNDLLREKGKLSSELEKRGWRTREWAKVAAKQIPSIAERKAISSYIDAGGDRGLLEAAANEVPANRQQAYRDALNLSPEAQLVADNISNYFNARLQEARDAGVLEEGLEDYIHRIYRDRPDLEQRAVAYVQSGILQANPGLARQRMFQFDFEAEKAGLNVEKDFIPRIVDYEVSLSKAIAARSFIREASKITMEDGQPMLAQAATGTPIETEAGRQATLIKPSGKVTRESDYVERPYSALKKWTWAANDVEGKPILVQGNLMVHKDAVGRIDALLKPSQVRYGRYGKLGKAALAVSSTVKQTMLDLSFFHQVQLTVHGLEHRVLPWKILKDIDFENPNVEGLLRGGVTLGGEGYAGNYMEGLVGRSLTQHIPGLGKVVRSYQDWLFQNYIPRLKMTMAMDALERNRKRYPKMAEEELMYLTAREANAAFGEQNYIMLERSKSFQDVARLIMLAPDFLESRGRFAAQAFTRFGGEQRMALLLGAVAMWTTARLINKATDDQWHFEPDNLFSVVHDGKAYGLRTVQGDILHLMEKPLQFWMYRLNPLYARTAIEGLTGRDAFGRKRTIGQQAMDAISTLVPISLRSSREKGIWESIAQSMGVNARRYSDVDSAFTLAKKWKDTHGIKQRGEFIYDPEKDELRGLKIALSSGDDADAVGEVKKLLESKTITRAKLNAYFDRYASMPFTGSAAHDRQFVAGLSEDERKTVQSAKNHKKTIRQLYKQALHQYDAAKATEPR